MQFWQKTTFLICTYVDHNRSYQQK